MDLLLISLINILWFGPSSHSAVKVLRININTKFTKYPITDLGYEIEFLSQQNVLLCIIIQIYFQVQENGASFPSDY